MEQHNIPLLTTKLQPPRVRPGLVPRPGLVRRLAEGTARKLTLITAPAGYGKTSLLLNWLKESPLPVSWLSLDEGDDDITQGVTYLVASLRTTWPDLGGEALNLLSAPDPPPPQAILTLVINQLAECPTDFVLVLDDYHVLANPTLQESFSFFIEHAPPQVHIIIASRITPSFPLNKYRARDQLSEITAGHLSFSLEETTQFFQNSMNLEITPSNIEKLHTQTEGWVTGLQIAGLAAQTETTLENAQERADYLAAFSGEHKYLFDYLGAEILDQLPPARQHFLVQTSILEELDAPLCAAVTGINDSHSVLAQLENDNLFTVSLEPTGQRYRYHHLFRDFLLTQADTRIPDELPALRRRAALWYAENDRIEIAIQHGLLSNDLAWTADQITARADTMWTHREMWVLRGWIEALPTDIRQAVPKLSLYHTWTLLMTGDFPAVDRAINDLEEIILQESPLAQELDGIAAVIKATYYVQTNQPGAIELYQNAIDLLPKTATNWLGGAYLGLGMAHYWGTGDLIEASDWLAKAVQSNRKIGNSFAALYANYFLGQAQIGMGRLESGQKTYRQALVWIAQDDTVPKLMASWAHLGLGEILQERGRPAEAAQNLLKAVQLGKQRENKEIIVKGLIMLAEIDAAMGLWTRVEALLQEAETYVHKPGIPDLSPEFYQARTRLALRREDISTAREARQDPRPLESASILPREIPDRFLHARLLLAERAFQEAYDLLLKLEKAAPVQKRAAWLEITISRALALAGLNQTEAAILTLKPALSFAANSGHKRVFLAEGDLMADLLAHVRSPDAAGRYAQEMLAEFDRPIKPPASSGTALIEPLSETEREILHFLAKGLTNEEIADHRVVSVNTVKWHLKNIFGKLGVRNRTAAVAQARGLGLVE